MKEKKTKKVATEDTPQVDVVVLQETDELEKSQQEAAEFKDKWMRTLAEFENFRRNTNREKQDWLKYANEKIILDLCEVLDNFERALATEITAETMASYVKGVELIFQQLNTILKKNDVIKIEVMGKEFDPNYHEALAAIPSEEPENTIVAVIQNGYMMNEKVIRPSRVAVAAAIKN